MAAPEQRGQDRQSDGTPSGRRPWPNPAHLASAGLLASLTALFAARPDFAASVTTIPPLVWLAIGLGVTAAGFRARRVCAGLLALWILFAVVYAEGLRSSLRPGFRITGSERASPRCVRVVSLNCAGGSEAAANEVRLYKPDIVLLQETPARASVERLATDLFGSSGSAWCGPDAAIAARRPLTPAQHPRSASNFVMAGLTVGGARFAVVSLRLQPPVARVDLWDLACWREHTRSRRLRRAELAEIMRFVGAHAGTAHLLVGGDFNAVAGDRSLQPIAFMKDSFDEAGRGWCDTAINDIPFARIDRLFVNRDVRILASSVRRTVHSDHRMLIVDLRVGK